MQRLAILVSVLAVVFACGVGGSALSQTTGGDKATQRMKNAEDPTSPAMQQQAAKRAECKKQSKAKPRAERKAFLKECMK
jgi:hypothetical protein